MQCQECVERRHSRRKTFVFTKSPHLNLASKDFKEAKQSNCFSADSLPDESAQCLRLGERQNLFKLKLKRQQNLYSNSIVRSQLVRNQLRQNYSIGFFEILASQVQMWTFQENIRFSSGMSSLETLFKGNKIQCLCFSLQKSFHFSFVYTRFSRKEQTEMNNVRQSCIIESSVPDQN